MANPAVVMITVPMVLEAISQILSIPKNKMQEYYDTSEALRNYITSLTQTFNTDVENELLQVTPSTAPRFDVPWITEELRKKQNEIFEIKRAITDTQAKAYESSKETFQNSPEGNELAIKSHNRTKRHGLGALITQPLDNKKYKDKFYARKKAEANQYTLKTAELHDKLKQVSNRPLKNNNPTYQSIQERKKNAQSKK